MPIYLDTDELYDSDINFDFQMIFLRWKVVRVNSEICTKKLLGLLVNCKYNSAKYLKF